MSDKERYEKAQLLKAGQVVEISGDWFRAIKAESSDIFNVCYECDLDSICRDDVYDICCELEAYGHHHWMLKLAHPV